MEAETGKGHADPLLLLHGGLNEPDAEPTAQEPTATQDPPLPSSNALGPNSNLHLGWYLPADNPSQPAPETTAAASSAQPPAEADAAPPPDERADLRFAAPETPATERSLSPHYRDPPPPSWERSLPGNRPASASAPVPFPGLAARALSTLTGRVTIGTLLGGIGILAAATALAIVGLPISDHQRPLYKRKPRRLTMAQWRAARARGCDELVRRLERLRDATRGLALRSHPTTYQLTDEPSPMDDHHYKHREDLIDACLAAWTAALWVTAGPDRVQILGADDASWTSEGSAPRSSRLLGPNSGCPSQHGVISAPRQLLKGLDSNFGVSYGSAQTLLQVVHSGSGDIRRGTRGNRG